jgi:crotonobetainyl-CoA:carnitine CoA-transferase CaiB-like acyl-CoA transferase
MDKRMPGALSGLRVLDLSRVLARPWAAQVFGDLGADVIKSERPGTGDETRTWGPPYLKDGAGNDTTEAAYFLSANRNKRSVCVDFTRPEGQEIIRKLAAECDILLENFKVGGLKQYGLDYETIRKINPRLIYCSITGFGQQGPYAPRAGNDFLIQGMGGLMGLTGRKDGEPGAGPQKVGVALTDILTGLYSVISVLPALNHRHATNEGQHVDLALLDVQVTSLANQNMNYLTSGKPPVRMGNAHPNIVSYQDFPTSDGDMMIAVGNDGQFSALCGVRGHPEWAADARFSTNTLRVKNRETIIGLLCAATATRATAEWVKACESVGVPCGPINDLSAVFDDPHIKSRQLKIELPHPDRRHHAAGRKSDPDVRNAGRIPIAAAAARRTHTRRARRDPRPESHSDVSKLAENKIVQARGLS